MNRVWSWILAALGVVAGLIGLGTWWRERERNGKLGASAAALAMDRARRAREQAQARLDEAVSRGESLVVEADQQAAKDVADALHDCDLVDHLHELNSGTDGG